MKMTRKEFERVVEIMDERCPYWFRYVRYSDLSQPQILVGEGNWEDIEIEEGE